MKNKFYLKSVNLIQDEERGRLYYRCEYSNGIMIKYEFYNFSENLIIHIELNDET